MGINLNKNKTKIAVDQSGEFIPKSYTERTYITDQYIADYPEYGELGVLFHAKGGNFQTVMSIDYEGKLVFGFKSGTAAWQLTTSEIAIDKNEETSTAVEFKEGQVTFYLNDEVIREPSQVGITEIPELNNYTSINNGARVGAPVTDFSGASDGDIPKLVALDGTVYEFLALGEDESEEPAARQNIGFKEAPRQLAIIKKPTQKNTALGTENTNFDETYNEQGLSVFPNPAKDQINILVEVQRKGLVHIHIFDLTGRQVHETKNLEIDEGHKLITLRDLDFSPGQYIVQLKSGNMTKSKQVIFE